MDPSSAAALPASPLARIVANLEAALLLPELEAAAHETAAPQLSSSLPAELEAAGLLAGTGMLPGRIENMDAYRWAILAALGAWTAPRSSPSQVAGPAPKRCPICGRLLESRGTRGLMCRVCHVYETAQEPD
jgi:hypothetical protein